MTSRKKSNPPWQMLERHFAHHKALVTRFRAADAPLVRRMWQTQTNEAGAPLSADERQALRERHCELFGSWPQD
jgi:hypothetical protein